MRGPVPQPVQQNGQLIADLCKIIEQQSDRMQELAEDAVATKRKRAGRGYGAADPAKSEEARILLLTAAARVAACVAEPEAEKGVGDDEAVRAASPLPRAHTSANCVCTPPRCHRFKRCESPCDAPALAGHMPYDLARYGGG